MMSALLISVLPIFAYIILLVWLDVFTIIRKERLAASFVWGLLCCFPLFLVSRLADLDGGSEWIPPVEDLLKYSFIIFLVKKNKTAFPGDSLIYGASVGAGFALVENILYALGSEESQLMVFVYRGLATSLMHIGTSGLAGALLILLLKSGRDSFFGRHPAAAAAAAPLPPMLLHYLHNLFILEPKVSLIVVVLGGLVMFLLLFSLNEKKVHDWMENSLGEEVRLAASYKAGRFAETEAGRYLLSVREQFNPEVFFDMIVYVDLYLKISIAAKGFLMLGELGMEIPKENLDKFRWEVGEFRNLRRSIGKFGVYTLSPIADFKRIEALADIFR